MSELTQTQLNYLVTAYGQATARTARAPLNSPAARYAFEIEDAACVSLLAAIGALVKERDELEARLTWAESELDQQEQGVSNGMDVLRRERDRLLHEHHQVRADAQSRVDAAVIRALAAEKALKEERAAARQAVLLTDAQVQSVHMSCRYIPPGAMLVDLSGEELKIGELLDGVVRDAESAVLAANGLAVQS